MIESLKIENFKCFSEASPLFQFANINLLTGINGRGKSSLLQSILTLSQSTILNYDLSNLLINGGHVQLGNFLDIKNSETPRGTKIRFDLSFKGLDITNCVLEYEEDYTDALKAKLHSLEVNSKNNHSRIFNFEESQSRFREYMNLTGWLEEIHYISADRLGPKLYVDKTNLPDFVNVGSRGENTINILANSDKMKLAHPYLYRGKDQPTVIQQTIEWLSYILDGAKIDIKGKDAESSVLYMLLNNKNNSYGYKPSNVGFGYSYVLPLIVSGLIANSGETIIIENPEAHLHPRAQNKIAEFFALVAASGVQVFIESHSEHILNGLRIAAVNPNIHLNHNDLRIFYFHEDFTHSELTVQPNGKMTNWPHGFFDQQEIDLGKLFEYTHPEHGS